MLIALALTAAQAADHTDPITWSAAAGATETFSFSDLPLGTTVTSQYFGYFYGGNDIVADGSGMTTDGYLLSGGGEVRIDMIFPATAVAADFPGGLTIELLDDAGHLLYTSGDFGGSGSGWFGGVVLGTAFTTIRLHDWSDGAVNIDNLYVGRGAGPTIDLSGSCPSAVNITATGFAAHGQVAIVKSSGPGTFTIPSGPCMGTPMELSPSGIGLVRVVTADGTGGVTYAGPLPAGLCASSLQFVDLATCTTSNVGGF